MAGNMLFKLSIVMLYLLVMMTSHLLKNSPGSTLAATNPWEGPSGDSEGGDSDDDSLPEDSGSGAGGMHNQISGTRIDDTEDEEEMDEEETAGPLRDVIDEFLAVVHKYEKNKASCEPGVQKNLGEGVITQFGLGRFKDQAMLAVNRANFLTRLWKGMPESFLENEYFFYTQVRSMLEGDKAIFAAGNCYDENQFGNYTLFCPYGLRMPNDTIMVKDLASNYPYLGNESEFFLIPKEKANAKLQKHYEINRGKSYYLLCVVHMSTKLFAFKNIYFTLCPEIKEKVTIIHNNKMK